MPTSSISNQFVSATAAGSTATKPSSQLDKDGFLKLLAAQMKNQDPSSNQDPSQYFQTIAQMSVVEQLTNVAQQSAEALKDQKASSAQALIGRTVSYIGKDGQSVTDTVTRVAFIKGAPALTVGTVDGIDPSELTEIK